MYQSIVQERSPVVLPEFNGERVYMRPFTKKQGLPSDLKRYQCAVDQMLDGVDTDETLYLMVDQKVLKAGEVLRRPGVHIDGYWGDRGDGLWCHGHTSTPGHKPYSPPSHISNAVSLNSDWSNPDFSTPEGLLLASNIPACRGWVGEYSGTFLDGGDASNIDVSRLDEMFMKPGVAYAGNVSFLHETLPVSEDCARILIRINTRGWSPEIQSG